MTLPLDIQSLRGGYGKLQVFENVYLRLDKGATLGLLGPNGVGKSTLLKTIAGLLPPLDGEVFLEGEKVTSYPAYLRARKGIALVPEGRQIFGSLSVGDNLGLVRNARPKTELNIDFELRRDEVYTLFPRLKERHNQAGGSLSGGEQQMLALGRALMSAPKVLMLDEPTQGLAPIVIDEIVEALQSLRGRFSILVVEQNRAFVEMLADRILIMDHHGVQNSTLEREI